MNSIKITVKTTIYFIVFIDAITENNLYSKFDDNFASVLPIKIKSM